MSTYNKLLHSYYRECEEADVSRETLRAYLFELCNEHDVDLYLEKDNEALAIIEERFHAGVQRILDHEPMNYVLGYSYFFGYKLKVGKDVLIPRYETEELIGLILATTDEIKADKLVVGDIGTGSGAIAIALKKEEPRFEVHASDISSDALKVAKENALINEADIHFYQGSMCEPMVEAGLKLDVLVSNPPYIKADEKLESSVVDYEPHVALFGGDDGLKFYRMILADAKKLVKEDGLIFFEMGYDQRDNLTRLAREHFPDAQIEVFKDLGHNDRMMRIILKPR